MLMVQGPMGALGGRLVHRTHRVQFDGGSRLPSVAVVDVAGGNGQCWPY